MRQPVHKSDDRQRAETVKGAVHRRKLTIAIVLFLIMAGLWTKVFMEKGKPKTASAAVDMVQLNTTAESAELKVVYTELPVVSQRHNVLGSNFFSAGNLSEFTKQGESSEAGKADLTEVHNGQGSKELETAAKEMELLAVVNDKKPQVFMEDKLLEQGQSFKFESCGKVYEFTVVSIMENGVVLECNGITITKKIPESFQAE
ncbi:MAG: hypothetical protein PHF37_11485 [Phycisphaerae bacterium]|nr:hypothetical protein [Phycisphaerae bacterium]